MIVEVDIGEVSGEGFDVKKELATSAQKLEVLIRDTKGDPLSNIEELAKQALRVIELYKLFEKN